MSQSSSNCIGGATIPQLPKIHSLQALTRLRPTKNSDWSVFAFVLNRDILKVDGTLDDLYSMVFPLGSFNDKEKAEEHAKSIIAMTGHPGVLVARYAAPVPLTTKFNPATITAVTVDTKGRIMDLESMQYKQDKEVYEQQIKRDSDLIKEAEEETNPNSIEYFKRKCYLAIKNRASYQMHSKEAETAWQDYKKREMEVRDHFRHYPEHESEFLPYLKEKLIQRGELELYYSLEAAYKEIREELLGLIENEDLKTDEPETSICIGDSCNVATSSMSLEDDSDDLISPIEIRSNKH